MARPGRRGPLDKKVWVNVTNMRFPMRFRATAAVLTMSTAAFLFAGEPPAAAPKVEEKPSGLKITYVAPGDPGAKDGDSVSVLYTGKLENGTVFDASEKHGGDPIEFILGKGMVIKGWDEGIKGMVVGEKRVLVIPPAIAYGAQGAGGGVIPPNATLTFDVELVGLKRTPPKQ